MHLPIWAGLPFLQLKIIGHRGAAGLVPENTIPSFLHALDLGCRHLELDVHSVRDLTGGHRLAVIHDNELSRTTNLRGRVSDYTAQALALADARGAPIPMLDQTTEAICHWCRVAGIAADAITLNVELKGSATANSVADFIAANKGDRINYLVSSFDHTELAHFRHCDANTPVAPLFGRWRSDWLQTASALRASTVNLSRRITTARRVTEIRDAGFDVWVYTVNTAGRAAHLAAMGVAGVFTDRPDRLLPKQIEVSENI
jgi:glycerophosphoryl diester phosphodiesterase